MLFILFALLILEVNYIPKLLIINTIITIS